MRPFHLHRLRPPHALPHRHYSTQPPAIGIAPLPSRTTLSLTGPDTAKFLHGLCTSTLLETTGGYTAFLTAPGRIITDAFVFPRLIDGQYSAVIDVDAALADTLASHLRKHKLRSKIAFARGGWSVWATWGPGLALPTDTPTLLDPRLPALGARMLLPPGAEPALSLRHASEKDYTLSTLQHGLPPSSILPGLLPHEANLDHLSAIDFRKGCYVGQELTIRTQHTGVVRKRLLPVQLYRAGETPPEDLAYQPEFDAGGVEAGTDIVALGGGKRPAGRWLFGMGNVGLALCRLENMSDLRVSAEGGSWTPGDEFALKGSDLRVKAFVPDWLRERETARQRSKAERKAVDTQ
ncbi:Aminomethyltransferase folate-binding domain-containing protein [Trichodelitschia bisporula]|uniref:Iron-sulfur cluster assembly factor IBA57 homolog, mitochondrial n=1 Tax=Trichodelitschia bisporula TaxID=703511 RepID=A0A6G1HR92_9PEZI|nr:Aminomethyltransferase folate-binding domain-containing protein [Trichodelitschia bisporula]